MKEHLEMNDGLLDHLIAEELAESIQAWPTLALTVSAHQQRHQTQKLDGSRVSSYTNTFVLVFLSLRNPCMFSNISIILS